MANLATWKKSNSSIEFLIRKHISMSIHICMGSVNISIKEEAYKYLKAKKRTAQQIEGVKVLSY